MLMEYILILKGKEYYCETNCDKEIFLTIIKDYKTSVKVASIKGLYRYLRQQGYRATELIFVEKEDAEEILKI